MAEVNEDLLNERQKATFDVESLATYIYGGVDNLRRKRYIQNLVLQDKFLQSFKPNEFYDRESKYNNAIRRYVYVMDKMEELGIKSDAEQAIFRDCAAPYEVNPFFTHREMIIPTIEKQGSVEQVKKWLPLAKNYQIIGGYAQTELGHGTFLRGLETTATYDPLTQEFVLESPTLSSVKYWPGGLRHTINHCLLMAQLYSQGQCYGPHMFLVQIRRMDNHSVMPGVELGDMGPKFGADEMDNGYMRFKKYRIPRTNMFMRYTKVNENGSYVRPPNNKLVYGALVGARVGMLAHSNTNLSTALVIAVRYSAVRRQGESISGGAEPQVLDYQTQQYKLLPLLATTYAFMFATKRMEKTSDAITSAIEVGSLDLLQQLHVLASGLKAFYTWTSAEGTEICRMSCGGHGYSQASCLPKMYANTVALCTAEGENTVLMLQTARYLSKYFHKRHDDNLPDHLQYLKHDLNSKSTINDSLSLDSLIAAYEHRAARMLSSACEILQFNINKGMSSYDSWNKSTVPFSAAAKAYCHLYVVRSFVGSLDDNELDLKSRTVLSQLCKLYAVHGIVENMGEFLQDGYLRPNQVNILNKKVLTMLEDARPNAVALVDAFDYPDHLLQSCLGRYDGQVYQALFNYSKSSPLNNTQVHSSYYQYTKPMVERRLKSLTNAKL